MRQGQIRNPLYPGRPYLELNMETGKAIMACYKSNATKPWHKKVAEIEFDVLTEEEEQQQIKEAADVRFLKNYVFTINLEKGFLPELETRTILAFKPTNLLNIMTFMNYNTQGIISVLTNGTSKRVVKYFKPTRRKYLTNPNY